MKPLGACMHADGQGFCSWGCSQIPETAAREGEDSGRAIQEENSRNRGPREEVAALSRRRELLLRRRELRHRWLLLRARDRSQDVGEERAGQNPLREPERSPRESALGDRKPPPCDRQHERRSLCGFFDRYYSDGSGKIQINHHYYCYYYYLLLLLFIV